MVYIYIVESIFSFLFTNIGSAQEVLLCIICDDCHDLICLCTMYFIKFGARVRTRYKLLKLESYFSFTSVQVNLQKQERRYLCVNIFTVFLQHSNDSIMISLLYFRAVLTNFLAGSQKAQLLFSLFLYSTPYSYWGDELRAKHAKNPPCDPWNRFFSCLSVSVIACLLSHILCHRFLWVQSEVRGWKNILSCLTVGRWCWSNLYSSQILSWSKRYLDRSLYQEKWWS